MDLREYVTGNTPVALDNKDRKVYEMLNCTMLPEMNGEEITAAKVAVFTGKLLQLAGGVAYERSHNVKKASG